MPNTMTDKQITLRTKQTLKAYDLLVKKAGGNLPIAALEDMSALDFLISIGPNLEHIQERPLVRGSDNYVQIPEPLLNEVVNIMESLCEESQRYWNTHQGLGETKFEKPSKVMPNNTATYGRKLRADLCRLWDKSKR